MDCEIIVRCITKFAIIKIFHYIQKWAAVSGINMFTLARQSKKLQSWRLNFPLNSRKRIFFLNAPGNAHVLSFPYEMLIELGRESWDGWISSSPAILISTLCGSKVENFQFRSWRVWSRIDRLISRRLMGATRHVCFHNSLYVPLVID